MTLDEAIKYCEEKTEEIWKANEEMPTDCKLSEDLCECAKEHEQLAEWLKELKDAREELAEWDKLKFIEVCQYGAFCPTNHCNDKDTIAELVPWIKDRNPDKDGDYLCIIGVRGVYYSQVLLSWTNNLYKIDKNAFAKYKNKKDRSGWYDYDSVWGYYSRWDVFAWCELPEMPEEFRKEGENENN